MARLIAAPIPIDRHPAQPSGLLALALRFGLSSHDASSLALALRLQLPLATQDPALRDAAAANGVGWVAGP